MKFTIESGEMNKILAQMMKIIPSKPVQPLLSCILLRIRSGILEILGTDLQNTAIFAASCTDCEDGEITVEAKIVSNLFKTLPSTPVTFTSEKDSVNISWGTGAITLPTYDAREFPEPKNCEGDKIILPATELKNALALAAPVAALASELHPTMQSVCLDFDEHMLNVVATDSHQLVLSGICIPTNTMKMTYLLPSNGVTALRNLAENTEGDIIAVCDGKNIKFATMEQKLICRLTEGEYPRYASILPSCGSTEMTINRDVLAKALKRISSCADNNQPRVVLTIRNKEINIQAKSLSNGLSGQETIEHNGLTGDELEILFNSELLISLLVRFPDKEVIMRFNGAGKAMLIYPTDKNLDVRALLMPTH